VYNSENLLWPNSDTNTVVTQCLLTFLVLHLLKPSTCSNHYVVHCNHPSKWCTSLTWERWNVWYSLNKTIQQHWFNDGFIQITVKKHLWENPFTNGTSRLLKLVAFILRKRNWADDQVKRFWSMFVCCFSIVHRNPHSGQAGNWVVSNMTMWRVLHRRLSF
jgi:membrane-bound metal-dependent hydrolase YbcI (DUF457 family)